MDKQMIEEMYQEFLMYKLVESTPETFSYKKMCEYLYGEGYRKIPEGAVVLTKAELAQIQSNFFDAGIKHGSKETAEKIAKSFHVKLNELIPLEHATLAQWEQLGPVDMLEILNEACKEITEGKE